MEVSQLLQAYLWKEASMILLTFNREGIILQANNYAVRLTGHPLTGSRLEEFFLSFLVGFDLKEFTETAFHRKLLNISTLQELPQTFYFSNFKNGEEYLLVGESNSMETEDLRKNMLTLNNELNNLTRELQKKNVQLDQLNKLKNQFLGMAAHDLRNPIGNILMYTDFILHEEETDISEEIRRILEIIYSSSQFMLNLLNELLDIVKIESGKLALNKEIVNVNKLLSRMIDINTMLASSKQIRISLNIPSPLPDLFLDPMRVEQVVQNLLSNAVKFSPRGTLVTLSAFVTGTELIVSVQDQGQGIPEAEQEKIFTPFNRSSPKGTAGEKSTGLGLSICRNIIMAHQGRFWLESQVGQGSVFSFSIPCITP